MARRPVAALFAAFVIATNLGLWLPAAALAGWNPDTEAPITVADVASKCTGLGILGFPSLPGTIGKRATVCLDKCNALDPEPDKAAWENACCALSNPVTVWLGNSDIAAKIQESLSLLTGTQRQALLAKCKNVRKTTGTGECVFGKESRPGSSEQCCVEKTVLQMTTDVNGKQCVRKAFTGSATCKADGVFGCCICKNGPSEADQTTHVRVGEPNEAGYNCQSCTQACAGAAGLKNGVPDFDPLPFKASDCGTTPEQAAAGKTNSKLKAVRQEVFQDMFCFTAVECAKVSRPENFKPGHGCPMKGNKAQGYCRAPEPDYDLQYPIMGIKTIRGLKNFLAMIFNVGVGFIIVASSIMFVWGAFKYMVSAVSKEIQGAQSTMIDSLIGLVLGLGAYAILANINPSTLTFMSFDVDMINRLNFYNVVYCKSIEPNTTKYAEAGTPDNPIDFATAYAKGYTLSLKDTLCGHEYFMEGGDSVSTCVGGGCKGGVCTNCSSMEGSGCRTQSTTEHACVDAHLAGNIILQGPWDMRKITAIVYCYKPTVGKPGIDEDRLVIGQKDIKTKNVKTQSTQGDVGAYSMKFEDIKKIKDFIDNKCKPEGLVNTGMLLTFDLNSAARQTQACVGCSELGGTGQFFIVGKNLCGKDLVGENQPRPTGTEGQRFIYNFLNYFDYLYRSQKDYFDQLVAGAWSLDDISAMKQDPYECTLMATWTALGEFQKMIR